MDAYTAMSNFKNSIDCVKLYPNYRRLLFDALHCICEPAKRTSDPASLGGRDAVMTPA